MNHTEQIRQLNDTARSCLCSLGTGRLTWTEMVEALPFPVRQGLLSKIVEFDAFTDNNDPHGEHDFGSIEHADETWFWKIDYFDKACEAGSENPADPKQTTRVLTIMHASEY